MAFALAVGLGCAARASRRPSEPSLRRFVASHEVLFARLPTAEGAICAEISTGADRLSVRLDGNDGAKRLTWRYALAPAGLVIDAVSVVHFREGRGIGTIYTCHQVLETRAIGGSALTTAQGTLHVTERGCRADSRALDLGSCAVVDDGSGRGRSPRRQ